MIVISLPPPRGCMAFDLCGPVPAGFHPDEFISIAVDIRLAGFRAARRRASVPCMRESPPEAIPRSVSKAGKRPAGSALTGYFAEDFFLGAGKTSCL